MTVKRPVFNILVDSDVDERVFSISTIKNGYGWD
jgi:hypothetical protein